MVYLDNSATTFVDPMAIDIINKSLKEDYINPSALYQEGRIKFEEIQKCKQRIASNLGLPNSDDYEHIYFTSGGCEGNNWIIKGCISEYYRYWKNEGLIYNFSQTIKKPHIITSAFEHHSILNACKQLEALNLAKITYIKPDPVTGIINPKDVLNNMSTAYDDYKTILVSIMWVNNVLGTIQPIKTIGDICQNNYVKFHTDAVQAVGNIHIDLSQYNIDFMTVSGHKFHAPKGIGFVYIKNHKYIQPLISGGGQEFGLRAGTENLPYIKALTYCFEKYNKIKHVDSKYNYIENIKSMFIAAFLNEIHNIYFVSSNGIGTFNISFKNLISDILVYNLGERGYAVSIGSACDNGNFEDSYILTALNYPQDYINGNIRITFNEFNDIEDIKNFIIVLKEEVYKLRGY